MTYRLISLQSQHCSSASWHQNQSKPLTTHVNSIIFYPVIQFWRCGGVCSIPISKIPQVLRFQAQGMKRFFCLWTHTSRIRLAQRLISAEFGLHVLRELDCAVVRGRSGPFGAHPSTLWAAQFLLHVSMQGCPCSLTGKGSRKCWKFKPHRPPSYTKKKTFACPKLDKNIRDTASIPNHCDVCIISH